MTRTPLCVLHTADVHLDGDGADGHHEGERLIFQRIVDLLSVVILPGNHGCLYERIYGTPSRPALALRPPRMA